MGVEYKAVERTLILDHVLRCEHVREEREMTQLEKVIKLFDELGIKHRAQEYDDEQRKTHVYELTLEAKQHSQCQFFFSSDGAFIGIEGGYW